MRKYTSPAQNASFFMDLDKPALFAQLQSRQLSVNSTTRTGIIQDLHLIESYQVTTVESFERLQVQTHQPWSWEPQGRREDRQPSTRALQAEMEFYGRDFADDVDDGDPDSMKEVVMDSERPSSQRAPLVRRRWGSQEGRGVFARRN